MNKVILIGNLGGDPKVRYAQSNGATIAKFSMATSEKWKDKTSGEMRKHTEWHNITAFGRLAEICQTYLSKGRQVCIEGKIQTSSYEKDGITRYNTEIIASTMKMLGSRNLEKGYNQPKTSEAMSENKETPNSLDSEPEEDNIPF